jgi:hypothetical protein
MKKKYISQFIILQIIINVYFTSCTDTKGTSKIEKSDQLIEKTDIKDYYSKRLNNILKINELNSIFKEFSSVDIIILQKNKCGLCDSFIYQYITDYAHSAKQKLVLLAVNDSATNWSTELKNSPTLKRIEIVEINNKRAQELGISFVETIQVSFVNRQINTYKVL